MKPLPEDDTEIINLREEELEIGRPLLPLWIERVSINDQELWIGPPIRPDE